MENERSTAFLHDRSRSFRSSSSFHSAKVANDVEAELEFTTLEMMPTSPSVNHQANKSGTGDERGKKLPRLGAQEHSKFIDNLIEKITEKCSLWMQHAKLSMGSPYPVCGIPQGAPFLQEYEVEAATLMLYVKQLDCSANFSCRLPKMTSKTSMTLLLGPPGCGKSTLLLALAGKISQSLEVTGNISYNGFKIDEIFPGRTSAYISQHDLHIPQMTVRETLNFSARCQGIGSREDILMEVRRREKLAGILPESDIDTYMEARMHRFGYGHGYGYGIRQNPKKSKTRQESTSTERKPYLPSSPSPFVAASPSCHPLRRCKPSAHRLRSPFAAVALAAFRRRGDLHGLHLLLLPRWVLFDFSWVLRLEDGGDLGGRWVW